MDKVLEKIYKVGLRLLSTLTLEETYALIVQEAMKIVKADYGSILLGKANKLHRIYASTPALFSVKPAEKGFIKKVFDTNQPVIVNQKEILKVNPDIKKIDAKSYLIIPLINKDRTIGVLAVLSKKEDYFDQEDLNILKLFGPLAALAIRKAQLYDEAKKAIEDRDLFISMAAHEFRTPLTTINGYIQLLHSKLSAANTTEARWVEELSWEITRLIMLVNELLAVHRIKSGQFRYQLKKCSLRDIASRAIREARFTHTHHTVVLDDQLSSHSDTVLGDYDKLLQVVTNLIDNAAKFSPQGTNIIIGLKFHTPYLSLTVTDQGEGISKKDLPEIFKSFYKGTHNAKTPGMGLGLFIAKNIIRKHRGFIKIRTKKGIGTSVEVLFLNHITKTTD